MPKIRTIYVVFKTHFDIGFTKLADEVIAGYSQTMLPAVVETCEKTHAFDEKHRYVWTMSAWPLVESLHSGTAAPEIIRRAQKLIQQGQIAWHVLPFTTHTEFCGLEELIRGLDFSKQLSEEYQKWPIAAKMTDVPGHTWILPSILHKAGVKFLHLGCNPGSRPPAVPRLFFWEGPDGNRVLTFYNKGFYGSSLIPPEDWPFPVWLALQQTGDNIGPQKPEIIQKIIDEVNREMPGTEVLFGTMDDFYLGLAQYPLENIPIIRGDLADSWIHGVGTYPEEVKQLRRLRPRLSETEKALSLGAILGLLGLEQTNSHQSILNTSYENTLLFGEHTWGLDVKTVMGYHRHYRKKEFLKNKDHPIYLKMERSWNEQRERVALASKCLKKVSAEILDQLAMAVDAGGPRIVVYNGLGWRRDAWTKLADHQKALENKCLTDPENCNQIEIIKINGGLQAYLTGLPAFGYKTFLINEKEQLVLDQPEIQADSTTGRLENHWFMIEVDREKGIVRSLKDKIRGKEWVDQCAESGFAQYRYDIYGDEDITEFIRSYAYRFYDWFIHDFGKMDYPAQNHLTFKPGGFSVTSEISREHASLVLKTEITDESSTEYGNAAELITQITLYRNQPWIDFEFILNGKTEIQLVEAGHFIFPINLTNPIVFINKTGSVINPALDIVPDANHTLYCCENWVDLSDGENGIAVIPFDTPLFSIGDQAIYKYRREYMPEYPVLFFNAFNNSWGTNFPQWMGGNYSFKYRLIPHNGDWKQGRVPRQAFESITEPIVGFAADRTRIEPWSGDVDTYAYAHLPLCLDLFQVPEGMLIQAVKPVANEGFIIRLREISGEAGQVTVRMTANFQYAARCDLLERIIEEIPIPDGNLSFDTAPFEIHSFYLK